MSEKDKGADLLSIEEERVKSFNWVTSRVQNERVGNDVRREYLDKANETAATIIKVREARLIEAGELVTKKQKPAPTSLALKSK